MTGTKISALSSQTGAALAPTDLLATVDVSDTSTAPAGAGGSDKKITITEFLAGLELLGLDARYQSLGSFLASFGGLRILTHSYGSYNGSSSLVGNFANFIRRFATDTSIPSTEIDFWYHSGMQASRPNIGDETVAFFSVGIGGFFRLAQPTHLFAAPGSTAPSASSKAYPSSLLMDLGVNDVNAMNRDPNGLVSAQQSMRAVLSLDRARSLYFADDASITYGGSGWGAVLTDKNYVCGAKYKSTGTLNDYEEITLPTTFKGGAVGLLMLGGVGGYTTLTAALTTVSGGTGGETSIPVALRVAFPFSSQQFVIQIDSEQMLVTAGWGIFGGNFTVTRGYNGTAQANHANGAAVFRPQGTLYLDYTASTSAAASQVSVGAQDSSGRTFISGQGCCASINAVLQGTDIQMVQRFNLTAADAGLTIRATLKNAGTQTGSVPGEWFRPFGWLIEDTDGRIQLIVNQPNHADSLTTGVAAYDALTATLNSNLAALAAEFGDAAIVDVAGKFSALFGATVQADPGSGGTTLHITPNDPTQNVTAKGSVLRIQGEVVLVTSAVTKTSNTDWSMTVTRNASLGVNGVVGTTGAAAHAIGARVVNCAPFSYVDGLHLSDLGHELYDAQLIATVSALALNANKIAGSGGYVAQDKQSWAIPVAGVAAIHYRPSTAVRTTRALTTFGKEYAEPWRCEWNDALISAFVAYVTTGQAGTSLRFGLYLDLNGYPGPLILDSGTVASTASSTQVSLAALLRLRSAWYWRSIVAQGTGTPPSVRATAIRSPISGFIIPETDLSLVDNPTGVSRLSMTGALTDWDTSVQTIERDAAAFPTIGLGIERFITG